MEAEVQRNVSALYAILQFDVRRSSAIDNKTVDAMLIQITGKKLDVNVWYGQKHILNVIN